MFKIIKKTFKVSMCLLLFVTFAFADTICIEQADQLYKNGKYKKAAKVYLKVIAKNPNNIEAHRGYIKTSYNRKSLNRVVSLYKRKIKANPDSPIYHYALGYAYGYQENFDKAIEKFKQVILMDTNMIYAYRGLGWSYTEKNMIKEAIKYYEKVLQTNPKEVVAIKALSFLYCKNKEYDKAIKFSTKAIELDKNNKLHYYNLGIAQCDKGNFEEAIEAFKGAIKLDHQFEKARYNLALVYADNKEYDKAIEQAKEVLLLNPNAKDMHYVLGNMYYDKKMYKDAVREYKAELKNSPYDIDCIFNLGQASSKVGKDKFKQEMLDYYNKALSSDPKFFERAVNYYSKSLSLDNYHNTSDENLPKARKAHLIILYLLQAENYFEKGNMCKGANFMERCLNLWEKMRQPDALLIEDKYLASLALDYLGQVKKYLEDKDVDKAEFLTEKSFQLISRISDTNISKTFAEAYYLLGLIYYEEKLNSETIRALTQAIKLNPNFDEVEKAKKLIEKINLEEQDK